MSYIEHAKQEFLAAGFTPIESCTDFVESQVQKDVLELLATLKLQEHTGNSIHTVLNLFNKLALFKPLTPLTGADSEWNPSVLLDGTLQNNRCNSIFKKNGIAYTLDGYKFWHWSSRPLCEDEKGYPGTHIYKAYFGSQYCRKLVTFPYTPQDPELVEVECYEVNKETNEREPGSGWWHTIYPEHIEANYNKVMTALETGVYPDE